VFANKEDEMTSDVMTHVATARRPVHWVRILREQAWGALRTTALWLGTGSLAMILVPTLLFVAAFSFPLLFVVAPFWVMSACGMPWSVPYTAPRVRDVGGTPDRDVGGTPDAYAPWGRAGALA
jgi:hypothetical protein